MNYRIITTYAELNKANTVVHAFAGRGFAAHHLGVLFKPRNTIFDSSFTQTAQWQHNQTEDVIPSDHLLAYCKELQLPYVGITHAYGSLSGLDDTAALTAQLNLDQTTAAYIIDVLCHGGVLLSIETPVHLLNMSLQILNEMLPKQPDDDLNGCDTYCENMGLSQQVDEMHHTIIPVRNQLNRGIINALQP